MVPFPLGRLSNSNGPKSFNPPRGAFSILDFTSVGLAGAIITCVLFTYLRTWVSFNTPEQNQHKKGIPHNIPYAIPFIGKAFTFAFSPSKCVKAATKTAGPNTAYGLKLLGSTLYFLTGRDNIARIRKYSEVITDTGVQTFCLIRVFGMAPKAVEMYNLDDSSFYPKPLDTSAVKPNNRIDYHTHANFLKMLNGEGLNNLFKRWQQGFSRRLDALNIGTTWVEGKDIDDFWTMQLAASLNEAMAGPVLEQVNPNFTREFVDYLPYVHKLMMGLPRWSMPRANRLRDGLVRDVKAWHDLARERFDQSDVELNDGADRWWGLAAMRERQGILSAVDNWDRDSIACSDFGLLWGANINVHTAAIWMIIEIFRDPGLLTRIRLELDSMTELPENHCRWVEELMALPLLQSVYAEVLRLRTDVQTVFRNNRDDIRINEWIFPKKSLLLIPTRPAHMDNDYWNTRQGRHPLDRFWADRFLAYPGDAQSGPSLHNNRRMEGTKDIHTVNKAGPKFIASGTSDSWIPYGVGDRACPGRFFAQREMVAYCAIMVQNFEIEFPDLNAEEYVPNNDVFYGLGVQRPKVAIPFRIRRLERSQ
ncbi:cytochrome P450 [Polyplosphaeria fusca]|uniref:Cytochrome P450 n=1 Tax=Polyplosphaeria fusca TaxID=682080 RepID=A0A9P4QKF4_9PLEO|nr:cytochrome P450 [Polyplosphaeria fusca]